MTPNLPLKQPTQKAQKAFDNDLLYFSPKQYKALGYELILHYPYVCYIDASNRHITFANRKYKPLVIWENTKNTIKWFDFDYNSFDINKYDFCTQTGKFDNVYCRELYLYSDATNPCEKHKWFLDYMQKLNYIESLLLEVSPFIKRFILLITKAYGFSIQKNENQKIIKQYENKIEQIKITSFLNEFRDLSLYGKLNGYEFRYKRISKKTFALVIYNKDYNTSDWILINARTKKDVERIIENDFFNNGGDSNIFGKGIINVHCCYEEQSILDSIRIVESFALEYNKSDLSFGEINNLLGNSLHQHSPTKIVINGKTYAMQTCS